MSRKRLPIDQIVTKLREAEVRIARGEPVVQACKANEVARAGSGIEAPPNPRPLEWRARQASNLRLAGWEDVVRVTQVVAKPDYLGMSMCSACRRIDRNRHCIANAHGQIETGVPRSGRLAASSHQTGGRSLPSNIPGNSLPHCSFIRA